MLKPGERAPDFVLLDETGGPTSLASLLRHGPLLLYFYPADFTPVCTREACLFRDTYVELNAAGLTVAGISPDPPDSHARFREKHALNYPLLADPQKEAIRAYGVLGPFGMVRRATFLIDGGGHVIDALLADLRVSRHEAFIREALARLESG